MAVSRRLTRVCAALAATCLLGAAAAGCGGQIKTDQADRGGAELFNERCSGCHSLKAANSYGSKPEGQRQGGERTNGPNFNQRREKREDVLFAIRNGGFSGAIMPANIVVGQDAEKVADFLSKYSGKSRGQQKDVGSGGQNSGSGAGG